MKTSKRILNILFVAALILGLLPVGSGFAEGAPLVTDGYDPNATMELGVKFSNFGNSSGKTTAYLSPLNMSIYSKTLSWITPKSKKTTTNSFDLLYNVDTLALTVNDKSIASEMVSGIEALNYIKLTINEGMGNGTVTLENLQINLPDVGQSFPISIDQDTSVNNWSISGIDLSAGFTISGLIVLYDTQPGSDKNMIEIGVGHTQVPKVSELELNPSPVYLNAPESVEAFVETYIELWDPDQVGYIESAKYTADYKNNPDVTTWIDMITADQSGFDAPSVHVRSPEPFVAESVGPYTACVQAEDSFKNHVKTCADYNVDYRIEDFLPPIDTTAVNVVKAGRTIPVIWRLTDYYGNAVEDPNSFAGLGSSYVIPCENSETYSLEDFSNPGESELQYLGEGYWQFNWKTSKTDSGCYMLFVEYGSGQVSKSAEFMFK